MKLNIDYIKSLFTELSSNNKSINITEELCEMMDGKCFFDLEDEDRLSVYRFTRNTRGIGFYYCGVDYNGQTEMYIPKEDDMDHIDDVINTIDSNTGTELEAILNGELIPIPRIAYEMIRSQVIKQRQVMQANKEYINTVKDIMKQYQHDKI